MLLSPKHQGYYDSLMLHLLPPRRWQLRLINHSRGLLFPPFVKSLGFQTASNRNRDRFLSLSHFQRISRFFDHCSRSRVPLLLSSSSSSSSSVSKIESLRTGEEIIGSIGSRGERGGNEETRGKSGCRSSHRSSKSGWPRPRLGRGEREKKVQVIYESCTVME